MIKKAILTFVILAVLVGGFLYLRYFLFPAAVNKDSWQAVFLRNDQVYFGRLRISDEFFVLRQVYYLQTEDEKENKLNPTASGSVDVEIKKKSTKLVKLGNELHGPEDRMFIEKSSVLFWENLKDSSSIVRSIKANEGE